jgi:hypothetical protein
MYLLSKNLIPNLKFLHWVKMIAHDHFHMSLSGS